MASTEAPRRQSSRIASRPAAAAPAAAPKSTAKAATTTKQTKRDASSLTTAAATKEDVEETSSKKAKVSQPAAPKASTNGSAGKLSVGATLPALTLHDEIGKPVEVASLRKSVLFTYPKANTGGCTAQACLYRDQYDQWKEAGFAIYGLSNDGQTSLKNWKEKRGFQYTLLSDPKRDLIGPLTGSKSSTPRSHFVIDAQGKLALSSTTKPADSSPAALKFAKGL